MKLWKVLARNSHVYNNTINRDNLIQKSNQMEMQHHERSNIFHSPTNSDNESDKQINNYLSESNHRQQHHDDRSLMHLTTNVKLRRKCDGESLGIVLGTTTGNSELESCPSIASLRSGSVAMTCDQLIPGDRIYSVNGINTSRMRSEDVTTLLDNVDDNALLEIQYSLPNYASSQGSLCGATTKITEVTLERIDGSLGITLRGGTIPDHPHLSRPVIITHIRPNGPAQRSGVIRVGDRLLKVDHHPLTNKTLYEAQQLLVFTNQQQQQQHSFTSLTKLTIEYDVSMMESVKYANGPLLVEIDRQCDEDFGLILTNCCNLSMMNHHSTADDILTVGYYIEHIIAASTADRCGALSIGDQLLAIDDLIMDNFNGTTNEAERLLRKATKLQILPAHTIVQRNVSRNNYPTIAQYPNLSPSIGGYSSLNSRRSRNPRNNRLNRQSTFNSCGTTNTNNNNNKLIESDLISNNYCGCSNNMAAVCHPETLNITLISNLNSGDDENSSSVGYGLTVAVGEQHNDNRPADILITRIVPDSPAYRSGCLQVGDRIILVNNQPNLTLQEINSILDLGSSSSSTKLILQIEFDVADTIVPSSGIFTVKLAKRGPGLGITITATKTRPDEPFLISEIRPGSIAHRTGTLHAGDRLLAIDNRALDHITLETAFEILQTSTNDIVTLKVEKIETENANLFLDSVVYTVELHRYGGPLGITISGSEDCVEPIILSRLTDGGLAEKTGALHVGDRILAINGDNLEHRPLSDAIRLLQTSGNRVQLKIARNIINKQGSSNNEDDNEELETTTTRYNYSSPGLLSVDSAIHSWDSNTADNNNTKDIDSILSELISQYTDSTTHNNNKQQNICSHELQFYSDNEDVYCPSPLPLPNYNFANTLIKYESTCSASFNNRLQGTYSNESILDNEIYHVTLYKDSIYDDYGFSVSDGLYEKGVYVNRIRKGGPADIVGLLQPYDRIIQVNDTKTKDFDCCLTVPLIASAGDRIELVIARNPFLNHPDKDYADDLSKKSFSTSQNTITKTL